MRFVIEAIIVAAMVEHIVVERVFVRAGSREFGTSGQSDRPNNLRPCHQRLR